MNKHLTSLLIKFIMIGLISVIILPLFAQISSGQAILIAVVLTAVAYLLGDLMILPPTEIARQLYWMWSWRPWSSAFRTG